MVPGVRCLGLMTWFSCARRWRVESRQLCSSASLYRRARSASPPGTWCRVADIRAPHGLGHHAQTPRRRLGFTVDGLAVAEWDRGGGVLEKFGWVTAPIPSRCRVGKDLFSSFKDLYLKPSPESGHGFLKYSEFTRDRQRLQCPNGSNSP